MSYDLVEAKNRILIDISEEKGRFGGRKAPGRKGPSEDRSQS